MASGRLPHETRKVGQESISDIIIKWVVTIFALCFVLLSIGIALICIYALPDHTVQAHAGALYLISGFAVIGIFVFVVWKNWSEQ